MTTTRNTINSAGLALLLLSVSGCGEPEPLPASGFRVAAQVQTGCGAPVTSGLPATVDAVVIEITDALGRPAVQGRVEVNGGAQSEVFIPYLDVVEGGTLTVTACAGPVPALTAPPVPFDVVEGAKQALDLVLRPVNTLSCAGTGRGARYDRYATLALPRALAAVATLPDGRIYIGGGAGLLDEGGQRWSAPPFGPLTPGQVFFSPQEALFLPSPDRTSAVGPVPLAPRVGAAAGWLAGGAEGGVLLMGGASAVRWGANPLGPLVPEGPLASPAAEWLDLATGEVSPVGGPVSLTPRLLPAVAQGQDEMVVVGGIEAGPAASARVEVIRAGLAATFNLEAPRVGASLTALEQRRYLLWGGDLRGDEGTPAILIDTNNGTARAIPVDTPPDAGVWRPTAYHAAARLPARGNAARLLITGGVGTFGGMVENNPELGGQTNAYIIELSATLDAITVRPLDVAGAGPFLRRALHGAATVGSQVLLTGGWRGEAGAVGNLTAAADMVLFDDDQGVFTPVPDAVAGQATLPMPLVGHLTQALPGGAVLIAGGVATPPGVAPQPSAQAMIWASGNTTDACVRVTESL